MWIQNVSEYDVVRAFHHHPGPYSMLISIVDPGMGKVEGIRFAFTERYHFKFLDVEDEQEHAISIIQANLIAELLVRAKINKTNVVVNCVAGIGRSGAVVEAGIAMGFAAAETARFPNKRVKRMVINSLVARGVL